MRYLGIDFGLKHVGLAIADGPLAEPLGEKNNNQTIFRYLNNLIETEKIDRVVIGLSEGKLAETIKIFGRKLGHLCGKDIIYQDETLTSQEAKKKLIEAGAPQKKRRLDHRAAAALILQEFLDTIN